MYGVIPAHRDQELSQMWNHSEGRAGGDPSYHVVHLVLGAGLRLELSRALSSQVLSISTSSPEIILLHKDAGSLFVSNGRKILLKISACKLFSIKIYSDL